MPLCSPKYFSLRVMTYCMILKCLNHLWTNCREANTAVPAIHPSPAHTVASLSASSISSNTRSVRIHHSESEASSLNGSPRHDLERSRTEAARYPSQIVNSTPSRLHEPFELHISGIPDVTPRSSIDSWEESGKRSRRPWYGPSRNGDTATISGSVTRHQMGEPNEENVSSPSHKLVGS